MVNADAYCRILGERVKEQRINLNYSQQNLADKVGLTKQAISRIERGEQNKTQIRKSNLSPLAIKLECTEQYLTGKANDVNGTESEGYKRALIPHDFVAYQTSLLHKMLPKHAESLKIYMEIIKYLSPKEEAFMNELLKAFKSYGKYKKAKSTSEEDIICQLIDDSFTKKVYEKIYKTVSDNAVINLRRSKLTKEDFVEGMFTECGSTILEFAKTEMDKSLRNAFESMYSTHRVRKGPFSRSINLS